MTEEFHTEIEKLAGIPIDLAFLTLDPRQKDDAGKGFDHCMRRLDIRTAVPMHCFGEFEVVDHFLISPVSLPYRHKILSLRQPGQTVTL